MRKILLTLVGLSSFLAFGQLSGTKTIPTDYPTIAAFVTDVNTVGVGPGGVTLNVPAGYSETAAPAGIQLTATGTVANPITIIKSGAGANPVINAGVGVATPGSAVQDGVFALVGSDYVTIDGIDITDGNTSNPATMEYGYGLFKQSATNGCQNVLIQNCVITLSIVNNATGSAPAFDGSRGINMVNSTVNAQTTGLTITANTGSNSFNRFYSNTIRNTNIGIALSGFAASTGVGPAPVAGTFLGDLSNDVGGASAATGNTITNFGGAASATNPAAGIRTANQWSQNVSYNVINNNNGSGANHVSTLRGILIGNATSATATVSNNNITVVSGSGTSQMDGISSSAGSTGASNTVTISNNVIQIAYSSATTGVANGIINSGTGTTVTINGNTITNVSTLPVAQNVLGGTGTHVMIEGGSPANLNITNNTVTTLGRTGLSGSWRVIKITNPTTTTISGNTVENLAWVTPVSTGGIDGIYSLNSAVDVAITNNIVRNLSTPTTGTINGIREFGVSGVKTITGNQVYSFATSSGGAGGATFQGIFASVGTVTIQNNTVYNLVSTGSSGGTAGASLGIAIASGTITTGMIRDNKVYDLSSTSTGPVVSGILMNNGTTVTIQNNLIGDLRAPAANAANPIIGINILSGTTANVYYNTVNISASSTGATFGSSAISAATGVTLNMNNNILVNNSSANGTGLAAAYRRSSTTLTSYGSGSNRNDFIGSTIYTDGTNTDATFAAYQVRVATRDANSINVAPNFTSTVGSNPNFLHINPTISTAIESGGANIAGITTDFDGNTRQGNGGYVGTGTAPDIGADEFELAPVLCSSANGGTISPSTASICAGSTRTMASTGATAADGITYQWKVSSTSGGPYSNVTGGSGANSVNYTTAAMTAGTYYYVLETTCSAGPLTGLSNEFTLTVNPTPVVSVLPVSPSYCTPGPATPLTASGATNYAWSPSTGLSAVVGATVNASPSATTTYTVIGNSLGCNSAPVPVTVTVKTNPVISSVTATPATICDGSNSQLLANATITNNSSVSAYSFATSTTPYTAITGTNLPAGELGDDFATGNLPIGFAFPYNGGTQNVFAVASNGFIELGSTLTYVNNATAGWTPSTNALAGRANIIAAIWEDNNTTGATVTYATTGTAPNRVLTVQWTGMHVGSTGSASNPTIDCQIQLFETSGIIKINYGSTSAALVGTTASIGLSGIVGNYLSVTPLTPTTASTSSSSENTGISSATNFPTGTVYTFTPPVPLTLAYSWSPATFLSSTTISNPVATAVNTTTAYTATVTASNGCAVTGNATVTVNPLPSAPTATNSAQCGTQVPTASVTSTTGAPTPTFHWYDAPTAGTLLQNSTSTTYTSNVASTTTFYVSEVSAAGCESARTAVTVTVAAADPIQASVDNATICIGSSINLSVVNTNPTPNQSYTYTWSGTAGSGLSSQNGAAITVTPTVAGTYTYSVSGVDGLCNGFSSVDVTVNPFTSVVTPINVSCNGVNNGSFAQGATSCGTAASYSVNGGPFGPIPTNLTAGTYSIVTMNTGGFTSAPQNITISTNVAPTVSISGSATPVCPGTSVPLTASSSNDPNYTYTWSSGLGSGASVSPAPMSTTTYTVTGTDLSGGPNNDCIATATFTITVNPVPTGVTATASDNLICVGEAVTLTSTPASAPVTLLSQNFNSGLGAWTTGYTGTAPATTGWVIQNAPYSYSSSMTFTNFATPDGGGFAMSNGDLGSSGLRTRATLTSPSFSTVGMSSASLTFQNLYQRWASGDSAVAVQVSIDGGTTWTNLKEYFALGVNQGTVTNSAQATTNETIALGAGLMNQANVKLRFNYVSTWGYYWLIDNIQLTGTPPALTYAWTSSPAGYTSSSQNPAAPVSPTTTTTYTMTATNSFGCSASASTTVTVNALPVVSAGSDQTVCNGTSVTFVGSGATSYTWNNGITDNAPFTATTTTTYTVTGTDANGCQNTDQAVLTVNALPTVNAGADQAVCTGSPATLTGTGTATGYSWNNGVSNGVAFTPASTLTYTVTGTDGNGCQNTDQVVVSVNALPTVGAGTDQTVCSGTSVTLNGSGATSYSWDNGVTDNTPFSATTTTTYTVTGTDGNGCTNTDQVTVNVNALPTVVANATQTTVCFGTDVTFTGSGATSYSWDNGVTDNVPFTMTATTTFTVTGTDANGCQNSDVITVNVNALPTVSGGADQASCSGSSVTLTGTGATSYSWDNGISNGVAFVPSSTLTYTVTGTDGNGCTNTDQVVVTVSTLPTVDAGADQTVCSGTSVTLSGSGATSYSWDNGVTDNTPFSATATTTYTVTGTDVNGCTNTDQVTVNVNALPTVGAGADQTVCSGTMVTLSGSGATSYSWDNGVTNNTPFSATATTTYTVTGTDGNGCTNTDQVTVNVNAAPTATATDNGDATITASAGTSYQWVNCTSGLAVAGATSQTFAPTVNGSYAVVVTNASGCSDTSSCVTINNVSVKEINAEFISVYPNPTHDNVTITMTANEANVVVVDGQGKTLKTLNVKNGEKVSLEEYATGVYFLNITTEFGTQLVKIAKN